MDADRSRDPDASSGEAARSERIDAASPSRADASAPPVTAKGAPPAVSFEGVTAERGGRVVLADVSIRIDERRVGLVGANGSGKSTLARLLNGLVRPSKGTVRVFGRTVGEDPRRVAEDVGFIFQNPDHQILFPTVEEEIVFGITRGGRAQREDKARARAFLAEHGAGHLAGRPVHELSEGQRHLVAILSVLVGRPRLLVLDEAFTSLDRPTRRALSARIAALPQHVIAIAHDLDTLEGFDRILWLADSTIRADGPPDAVLPAYVAAMDALDVRL